jgi:hypothetical protein
VVARIGEGVRATSDNVPRNLHEISDMVLSKLEKRRKTSAKVGNHSAKAEVGLKVRAINRKTREKNAKRR